MCRLFGSGRSSPAVNDDSSCQLPPARCAGCDQPFNANDLVMKVHLFVFHSSCFSCCVCRNRLSRGQQFALVDTGHIYCRADYERRHAGSDLAGPAAHDARRVDVDGGCEDLPCDDDDDVGPAAKTDEDCLSPSSCGLRTYCRRSWRTRKLTPSVHRNGAVNGDRAAVRSLRLSVNDENCVSHSSTPRQKRLRTSFKHQQLRVLRTYFALNHNPDAKDLKQLSQKTGLGKRILQVWFQNTRAKYRRSLQRGDSQHRSSTSLSGAALTLPSQQSMSMSTLSDLETETPNCCTGNTSTSATSSVSSSSTSSDLQLTASSVSD